MVGNKSSMRVIGTAQEPLLFPSIVLLHIGINVRGILSRTYIKIPPRSDLKILYPSMMNYMEENDSSSLVSDVINTSTFSLVIAIK